MDYNPVSDTVYRIVIPGLDLRRRRRICHFTFGFFATSDINLFESPNAFKCPEHDVPPHCGHTLGIAPYASVC